MRVGRCTRTWVQGWRGRRGGGERGAEGGPGEALARLTPGSSLRPSSSLPRVQQRLLHQGQPEGAHAPAHGREALEVPALRAQRFRTSGRREDTHAVPLQAGPQEGPGSPRRAAEGPQPWRPAPSADPGVFIMNSPVLAGQLDQSLLQPGLLGQTSCRLPCQVGRVCWGARGEAAGRLVALVITASSDPALPEISQEDGILSFRRALFPFSHSLYHPFCILPFRLFGLLGLNLFVS